MTKLEEYQYLSDLVMQAALWRVDKDEGRTALELEVLERLKNLKDSLNGCNTQEVSTTSDKTSKQKWTDDKCRVGNRWHLKSECVKVPRKDGIGWKWALKQKETNLDEKEESSNGQ